MGNIEPVEAAKVQIWLLQCEKEALDLTISKKSMG